MTATNVGQGLGLAWRGFSIVVLTAANVFQIAHQHYGGAFVVGTAISVIWWQNASRSSQPVTVAVPALWYGVGAGLGTISGMCLMRAIYG